MERAFLTRAPETAELALLSKFLGSYRDGSGNNREADGYSRADSRQIERCFAELLHGKTTENKSFYDFAVESNESGLIAIRAASIKSKEHKRLHDYKKPALRSVMRAHLEISNSFAKDWALCRDLGLSEEDFREHKKAQDFGKVILMRQTREREASEQNYLDATSASSKKKFISKDCVFISVMYSPAIKGERSWLISSFNVLLPEPAVWQFRGSCVVGLDKDGGIIYEWYALSGSQFKYYPRIIDRLHGTDLFECPRPAIEDLRAKSTRLFGT